MIDDVLRFWFADEARPLWFKRDAGFDADVRQRYADLVDRAAADALDDWLETPQGALALTLVLDQFPRNIHRGRAAAFACDAKARQVADMAIGRGHDRQLDDVQRVFLYLPFEHSESLADQERSLRLFTELGDAEKLDYAVRHHEIIARFGRFPHRNAVLGRRSTAEEQAFLTQPESSF